MKGNFSRKGWNYDANLSLYERCPICGEMVTKDCECIVCKARQGDLYGLTPSDISDQTN